MRQFIAVALFEHIAPIIAKFFRPPQHGFHTLGIKWGDVACHTINVRKWWDKVVVLVIKLTRIFVERRDVVLRPDRIGALIGMKRAEGNDVVDAER